LSGPPIAKGVNVLIVAARITETESAWKTWSCPIISQRFANLNLWRMALFNMCPIINQRVCRFGGWFVDFLGHLWTIQSQTQPSLSRGSSLTFIFCSSESRKSLTSACPDRPMHFPTGDPEPKTYTHWGSWIGSLTRFQYPEWWTPLSKSWQRYYLSIRFKLYIPRVFWHCFHLHHWTIFWISLIQNPPHEFTQFLFVSISISISWSG